MTGHCFDETSAKIRVSRRNIIETVEHDKTSDEMSAWWLYTVLLGESTFAMAIWHCKAFKQIRSEQIDHMSWKLFMVAWWLPNSSKPERYITYTYRVITRHPSITYEFFEKRGAFRWWAMNQHDLYHQPLSQRGDIGHEMDPFFQFMEDPDSWSKAKMYGVPSSTILSYYLGLKGQGGQGPWDPGQGKARARQAREGPISDQQSETVIGICSTTNLIMVQRFPAKKGGCTLNLTWIMCKYVQHLFHGSWVGFQTEFGA